jgi:AMMECR1 domain-containing protein
LVRSEVGRDIGRDIGRYENPITLDQLIEEIGNTEKLSNPAEFAYNLINHKSTHLQDQNVNGCFLTLKNNSELRFCIGKFTPGKLSELISSLAKSRDNRFPPISNNERRDLQV